MTLFSWWLRSFTHFTFSSQGVGRRRRGRLLYRLEMELLESRVVPASTRTWSGGALAGDKWTNANNWVGKIAPVAGDELVFPPGIGALDRTTNNDFPAGTAFSTITFTGDDYTLSGNPITLGGIIRFNVPAPATVLTNTIEFDVALSPGNKIFSVGPNQRVVMAGAISGGSDLFKILDGDLIFSGSSNNFYSGTTRVNDGRLRLDKDAGANAILGPLVIGDGVNDNDSEVNVLNNEQIADTAPVTINAGGFLDLHATETIGPLTLTSGAVGGPGTLVLSSNVVATGLTNIGTATLSLGGGTRTFDVAPNATLLISPSITNGSLIKNGAGFLRFVGSFNNNYTGATTVHEGTLGLSKNPGATGISGALVIGDPGGGVAASVVWFGDNQIADNAQVTVNGTGLLNLGDKSDRIGLLTLAAGTVTTGTGSLILSGGLTTNQAAASATITGNLIPDGVQIVNVADGAAADDLVISAQVRDLVLPALPPSNPTIVSAGMAKFGAGKLVLAGANTYTGLTTVTAGTMEIRSPTALGSSVGATTVSGGALVLTGGLAVGAEALNLSGTGINTAGALRSLSGSNSWSGNITLTGAANSVGVDAGSQMALTGAIGQSVSNRPLAKVGAGPLTLGGTLANSYGATTVQAGNLLLGKPAGTTAVAGPLTIGDGTSAAVVQLTAGDQIADGSAVTVNNSSTLNLNSFSDTIGPLTLTSGSVATGTGTLTLAGDVATNTASSGARIDGNLALGSQTRVFTVADGTAADDLLIPAVITSGGLVKQGTGSLVLTGPNSFAGSTMVNAGSLQPTNDTALGTSAGGTTVNSGGTLLLAGGLNVAAEALTLSGTGINNAGALRSLSGSNTWAGNITLAGTSNSVGVDAGVLTINGAIGQAGTNRPLAKVGGGTLLLGGTTANSYTGTTSVQAGNLTLGKPSSIIAIAGSLTVGNGTSAALVKLNAAEQIVDNSAVTVNSSSTFDLGSTAETIGALTLGGATVTTGAGVLALNGDLSTSQATTTATISGSLVLNAAAPTVHITADSVSGNELVISAVIHGNKGLAKDGIGQLALTASNVYTGATAINQGFLLVNGAQPGNAVNVGSGGLGGSGQVGAVAVVFGGIDPGQVNGVTTGILTANGNVTLASTSNFSVNLNGTSAGTGYDQLKATAAVNLGNSSLFISLGFASAVNDLFTIIDSVSPIQGTFNGLAEGAQLTVDGQLLQITYVGGDGNDVVLKHLNTPPAFQNRSVTTPVNEGDKVTLTGNITEPDENDTFNMTVDWGDGSSLQKVTRPPGTSRALSLEHVYEDDNPTGTPSDTYMIHLVWTDQHGGPGKSADLPVTVNNVPPVLSEVAATVRDGRATLAGLIGEPGQRDSLTLLVDWGEGASVRYALSAASTSFHVTHLYRTPGQRTVSATLTDDDLGVATAQTTVQIDPFDNFFDNSIPPPIPTLTGPGASTANLTPTLTWTESDGAATYDLWVDNLTTGAAQVIRQSLTTNSFTPPAALPLGSYRTWVQAIADTTLTGGWSIPLDFTVAAPDAPNLLGPTGTTNTTPFFSWEAVADAAHYDLWVDNVTAGLSQVVRQSVPATTFSPDTALPRGTYTFWVRAANSSGDFSDWSVPGSFVVDAVVPASPALFGPGSSTADVTPTIAWSASAGATTYDLWVDNLTTGATQVIRQQSLTTNSFTPADALPLGSYRAWVQAAGAGNTTSAWSAPLEFTITTPATPTLIGPTGSVSNVTPVFSWEPVPDAVHYDLWVDNLTTGATPVLREEHVTTTSFTPAALGTGTYRFWVRAVNATSDAGSWSDPLDFSVV